MASNALFLLPPPIIPGKVGIVLIVANDYRDTSKRYLRGTVKDAHIMNEAFQYLGYHTILKLNVSKAEFVTECEKLASYNYGPPKRIAVVFSGHGAIEHDRGVLIMQDGEVVIIKELVNIFKPTAKGNHTLASTTRMFFIDACRGDLEEPYVVARSPRGGHFIDRVSSEAGILIAYSTTENHKAYEGDNGGFWIQFLAHEMCTLDDSLQAVLTKVNKRLNEDCSRQHGKFQTAQVVSQLIEDVYFLRERPPHPTANSTPGIQPMDISNQPSEFSTGLDEQMDTHQSQIKEVLTSQGITCQYHIVETPSRQPGCLPSYLCELTCHSNGMNYKFRSTPYHNRDDAKRDVNEQARKCPEIGCNEIFSRSAEDEGEDPTSRVEKLAEYCKSKRYRPPSYSAKLVANGYISTVLVPRNGKYEGEVAETIELAKEKAAKKALLELKVIVDPLKLL